VIGKRLGVSSRQWLLLTLAVVIAVGMVVRLADLQLIAGSPDENNYANQAALVLKEGRAAFPSMLQDFRADPGLPPPTRAGYLYALAGVMRVTGEQDQMAAIWMSAVASLISLLLVARLAWRFLSPEEAVVGVSLYAASPLALMIAHRGWQEAFAEMLAMVLLLSASEIIAGMRKRSRVGAWMAVFCVAGAACLTVKEVTIAVFLLVSLAVAWMVKREGTARRMATFGVLWFVAVAVAVGWLTWLLGDVSLLWKLPQGTSKFIATSSYSVTHENGTLLDFLKGLWKMSPLATVGFPLGLVAAWRRGANREVVVGWGALTLVLLVLVLVEPHHMNYRFLSVVYGPLYLLAGAGLVWVAGMGLRRLQGQEQGWAVAGIALVVGMSTVSDYATFRQQFLVSRLSDLSIRIVECGNDRDGVACLAGKR